MRASGGIFRLVQSQEYWMLIKHVWTAYSMSIIKSRGIFCSSTVVYIDNIAQYSDYDLLLGPGELYR